MIRHPASRRFVDRSGFGTIEAVLALLIASLALAAITAVASNSIDRSRRAEEEFRKAVALETLSACVPRIPRPPVITVRQAETEAHPCFSVQAELDVLHGVGTLRGLRPRESSGRMLLILNLERGNP